MKNNLVDSKDLLAKLLATENITVRHLDTKSASFDTENRVLTCPIWKDMDGFLYDLIFGHEIGHALYTPNKGWLDYQKQYGRNRVGFVNVIEDARIEKLIKRKFPGIRKSFVQGYKDLLDRNFFGINELNGDTSQLNLIDRLNMHFKCGSQLVIKFSEEEREFVKMTENAETWYDVVEITNKIWDYCKKNEQEKVNCPEDLADLLKALAEGRVEFVESDDPPPESGENNMPIPQDEKSEEEKSEDCKSGEESEKKEDEKSDSKSGSDDEDGEEEESDSSGDSNDGEGDETDEESDEKSASAGGENEHSAQPEKDDESEDKSGGTTGRQEDKDPESLTDTSYRNKEKDLLDPNAKSYVLLDLPECDLKKTIVPCKVMIKVFEEDVTRAIKYPCYGYGHSNVDTSKLSYDEVAGGLFNLFTKKNAPYIAFLVKEFEMRKNAKQYSRQLESKSGELDMRSLAKYKFTNDIFRKFTETPKGKSHGMLMFVDMSSSMIEVIRNTMEQAVVLAMFCKKVGVPFYIYGFSNNPDCSYDMVSYNGYKFNPKTVSAFNLLDQHFHLKTLIDSDLNARDFKRAAQMMLVFGTLSHGCADHDVNEITKGTWIGDNPGQMRLYGTPFIETLVASKQIINNFKSKTHVDIVNVVYLTDGEGGYGITMPAIYMNQGLHNLSNINLGFVDPVTKKRVMVDQDTYGNSIQAAVTKLIRDTTGCRHIGFYIGAQRTIKQTLDDLILRDEALKKNQITYKIAEGHKKSLKDNGYFCHPTLGYDSYYYITIKNTGVQSDSMCVNKHSTKSEIQREFMRTQSKKHSNRALVSSFAKEIAA
jgi:hypothetical protein